jgi:hypothetical protein
VHGQNWGNFIITFWRMIRKGWPWFTLPLPTSFEGTWLLDILVLFGPLRQAGNESPVPASLPWPGPVVNDRKGNKRIGAFGAGHPDIALMSPGSILFQK